MAPVQPRYDLIIVGASFAGLATAKTAAMRGLKVAVLDRKPEAGYGVATTGILVKEAAEELDVPHALTRRVHGIRLYAPNLKHIDLFSPGYFFLTTDTPNLLRWLASEATRAGADILWRAPFEGAWWEGGVFRFAGLNIAGRYILGADGGQSRVARHFGLGRNKKFLTGLEIEYEGIQGLDPRFLHCFLDSEAAPGYLGWAAPGPLITHVGLAVSPGRRPSLPRFLEHSERVFSVKGARIAGRRAGRIPCGGLVKPWSTDGVMLIGDAAGMVSPATGGGIKLAFQFGRRAAHAIADHLLHLGPKPELTLAPELPRFSLQKVMRFALNQTPHNALLSMALGTAPMRWFAERIYFHRRGKHGWTFDDFEARLRALDPEKETRPLLSTGDASGKG